MYANEHSISPQNVSVLPRVHHANNELNVHSMYSCQAPRGYEHIYQCPVHLQGENNLEHSQHHIDPGGNRFQGIPQGFQKQGQEDVNDGDPTFDQHSGYQYSSSDYSSTDPIYAQPNLYTERFCSHAPTIDCNNQIGSLRTIRSYGGTAAAFLVRSDSYGNSTVFSTLPTVSAVLAQKNCSTHVTPVSAQSMQNLQTTLTSQGKRRSTSSTKHKRKGLISIWQTKFVQGGGGRQKFWLLFAALVFLIILVLGVLATILYLAVAGDLSSLIGSSKRLIEITETGSNLIDGEFSITNQNFQPVFKEHLSSHYKSIVKSIENELDILFAGSVWSRDYNHTHVVSLLPLQSLSTVSSGLLVRVQLTLNNADADAAKKFSSAFLRGLDHRHGHDWLGPYAINITSIRFTAVLVDTSTQSSTSSIIPGSFGSQQDSVMTFQSAPYINVGWGSWGSWSTCSPCSLQFDQIRTRQCRLDSGQGLLINSIEPCLVQKIDTHTDEAVEEMETRPCQCNQNAQDHDSTNTPATITTDSPLPSLVTTITNVTTTTTSTTHMMMDSNPTDSMHHCKFCFMGEVCIALAGEAHPTCRSSLDASDPTGCGGLCIMDSEVCQALGSRAFSCHNASQCLNDEWRCSDGLCIPRSKRCDGHMNCYDQSDEHDCSASDDRSSLNYSFSTERWHISDLDQRNPADVLNAAPKTKSNIADGFDHLSHPSPSMMSPGSRMSVPVLNRTAIGLSSLSHRERELLS